MLYHFSEEPGIERFVPRPIERYPQMPQVVFAIDEAHAAHYLFPRDCPRVIYWKADWTTPEDEAELFAHTATDKIIAVESGWLERIRRTKLYRYAFPPDTFRLWPEAITAGYHISEREVIPQRVELMDDLIGRLVAAGIELRITPNLHPLRNRVIASTADFSVIRFRNALPA
ncbi:MAG: hypothetical protein J7639_00765 [Paenibacillaceae bacterium]|nr:hypothetical protein [Paenibacillaceae bacterium]